MELNNEFEVDRPIGEAWALLTDVERIAPESNCRAPCILATKRILGRASALLTIP